MPLLPQVMANPAWVGTVDIIDPPGGAAVTALDYDGARALADAAGGVRAAAVTPSSPPSDGGAASAALMAPASATPLLPVRPVPSAEPAAFLMLQVQTTAYMGEPCQWTCAQGRPMPACYPAHPPHLPSRAQVRRWPSAPSRASTTA